MSRVTFINPLRVPPGREDEFLRNWDEGAEYVRSCAGFVSTSLHRSLNASSRFQYFTVAVWESAADFYRAMSTDRWRRFVERFGFGDDEGDFGALPTLCEPVRE